MADTETEAGPLLEPKDVKNRWLASLGPIPATDGELEHLLEDAEGLILDEFPDIPRRIREGKLQKRTVVRVGTRMVLRLLHNPDGARTTQESDGLFSQSRTIAGDTLGEVYLSAQDRAELTDNTPAARTAAKAFTLMPRGA